jgi:hypothetical protein
MEKDGEEEEEEEDEDEESFPVSEQKNRQEKK